MSISEHCVPPQATCFILFLSYTFVFKCYFDSLCKKDGTLELEGSVTVVRVARENVWLVLESILGVV